MSGFNRLLKNSVANVINGFSNVILGIVISPFLLKTLSIDEFSLWSLIIQVGAFFSLLGFGAQLTVARFVTLARAKMDVSQERKALINGLYLSYVSVTLGFLALIYIYNNFYYYFDGVKNSEILGADTAFFIVSLSFILGLISSVYSGYFTGIERNDVPAVVNLISRVVLGGFIVFSAKSGVVVMSVVYFFVNVASYVAIYIKYRLQRERSIGNCKSIDREFCFKAFCSYCLGISVLNLSMFLLVSFNGILVGKYAFGQYAFYSLAITLVTAVIGFMNAALSPILQPLIHISHEHDNVKINKLIYDLTIFIMLLSLIIISGALCLSSTILDLWIGNELANKVEIIFIALLAVNLARLVGAPLGLLYLAQAKQNRIMILPFIESAISVGISILYIDKYGMYAVPLGLAIAVAIILFIYAFTLINIMVECRDKVKYGVVFILYPSFMYLLVYLAISVRSLSSWFILMPVCIVVISSYFLFIKTNSLRIILGR